MTSLENKQMAKEILIEMIRKDYLLRTEYQDAETVADMACSAYKTILKTISES